MAAILKKGAVCESHTLPTMSSRSFVIRTHSDWFYSCRQVLLFGCHLLES